MRRAGGSMRLPASARCWPLLWLRPLPIQRLSDRDATSQPGSGSCRSSIQAVAKTDLVISANKGTAICAACSSLVRSPLSAMPRSMAPDIGPGLGIVGAAANEGGCYRARQQDRSDGLGDD